MDSVILIKTKGGSLKSKFEISSSSQMKLIKPRKDKPEEMAKTYTDIVTSEEAQNISGKYFNEKNKEVRSSKYSEEKTNIQQVMELSLNYLK